MRVTLPEKWSKEADDKDLINTDRNLRLQYVAGLWINNTDEGKIFNNILRDYSYPKDMFFGKQERLRALYEILESTGRHDAGANPARD